MKILLRFDEGAAFCRPSTRQKRKLDVRGRQNAALRKEISTFVNISLIHALVVLSVALGLTLSGAWGSLGVRLGFAWCSRLVILECQHLTEQKR